MNLDSKIYIAGHHGLVGSAIVRLLQHRGYHNLILKTRSELNLLDQQLVRDFFATEKPEYVFLAAAKVGGINANKTSPAPFIYENLAIQNNIIHSAYEHSVSKLLFLGSSCVYPGQCPQPMKEEYLMSGKLEPTNLPYAVAKIAGITLCQSYNKQYGTNFISVMPSNLYGPNDNFDLADSHVLPALIRRCHEAKERREPEVQVWGTGNPKREFLHVDDLVDACLFLMDNYNDSEIINIGSGEDISIKDLAEMIQKVVGYEGKIVFDTSKPDGTIRKLVDVTKINQLGWRHQISFDQGVNNTYQWYLTNVASSQQL